MSAAPLQTPDESPLHWVRTGTDHAETIVLIHAVGYDLTYWDRQIEALYGSYNVVAFDLPGHGNSPGDPEAWSFEYAAGLVAELIRQVSSTPVHLVGISFGSMIAQATVLAYSDLVRTLTLIGTASSFAASVRDGMRSRAEAIRNAGMTAVLQSSLERWYTPRFRAQRPDVIDRVSKTLLADDPATQAAIWEIIANFNVTGRLAEIAVPTLVLVGEADPSTPPSAAKATADGIRRAKLIVIPQASHLVTVEAPNAVNEAMLGFLAEAGRQQ